MSLEPDCRAACVPQLRSRTRGMGREVAGRRSGGVPMWTQGRRAGKTFLAAVHDRRAKRGGTAGSRAMVAVIPANKRISLLAYLATAIFAAALLIAAPAPARAQAAPTDDSEIIVQGRAETAEDRRAAASAFVRQLGVAEGQKPVARWIDPVCVKVSGLSAAHAAIVKKRLRAVALAAGAPVDVAPCRTNVLVSFVERGGDMVRRLMRRAGSRFREVALTEREQLRSDTIPARWWYNTEIRDKYGQRANTAPLAWAGGAKAGSGSIMTEVAGGSLNHYGSSLVSTQAIRALTSATIVIDANLVQGASLDSVAAHAALVVFAEIDRDASPPTGSILGLYRPDATARNLSERDRLFLRELYAMPLDRRARQQRNRLIARLAGAGD